MDVGLAGPAPIEPRQGTGSARRSIAGGDHQPIDLDDCTHDTATLDLDDVLDGRRHNSGRHDAGDCDDRSRNR